jgi:hypothetical protein
MKAMAMATKRNGVERTDAGLTSFDVSLQFIDDQNLQISRKYLTEL